VAVVAGHTPDQGRGWMRGQSAQHLCMRRIMHKGWSECIKRGGAHVFCVGAAG
jgi:hypothetical protein